MNDLYSNEWRLLANLFLPSVKLANKIRVGSRIKRVYEDPKTPLDRLVACKKGNKDKVDALVELRRRLDPIVLSKTIDIKLQRIWRMASKPPRPSTHRPGRLPSYADKPLAGPPNIPHSIPPLQRYERVWEREQRLQTA